MRLMNIDWRLCGPSNASLVLTLSLLVLSVGCGKKQKNIFVFQEKQTKKHVPVLQLPLIKGVKIQKKNNLISISWPPLPPVTKLISLEHKEVHLVGYNVYSFDSRAFISKKPHIISQPFFEEIDPDEKTTRYYVVSGLFESNGVRFEGPKSKIISA